MNVNKAVNYIIVFFLILNVILFALNLYEKSKYKITVEQEKAIISVLQKNNIGLYTYLVKDFNPLRQIEFVGYDSKKMISPCFNGIPKDSLKHTVESDATVYRQEGSLKKFTIYTKDRTGFLFEDPSGGEKIELNKEAALAACEAFISRINDDSLELKFDFISDRISNNQEDYYLVEYRTVFGGYTIYSSLARFKVTEKGVTQLRGTFYVPERFSDKSRQIHSCDEALYALMQKLRDIYGEKGELIKISDIDIAYRTEDSASDVDAVIKADPYYRIYVSTRLNQPFLVNAYTNEVIN